MPGKVTEDGRKLGLLAAHAGPRCQATRRNGQPCRAAALRGARRCVAHGGRVDVTGPCLRVQRPRSRRRTFSGLEI